MTGSLVVMKLHRWSLLQACLFLVLPQTFAQTTLTPKQDTNPPTKAFAYEVVSIHPAKPRDTTSWGVSADGLIGSGMTVRGLIMNAYRLVTVDQLAGVPSWADSDGFDIQAKMDADTVEALGKLPKDERYRRRDEMLQALLVERFHLKIRHEEKVLPVYALVAAKGGTKLKESPANAKNSFSIYFNTNSLVMNGQAVGIASLAISLSSQAGRVVVDKTGLTGKYDIDLKWSPQENASTDDSGPSLFTALEEQLGLKLESAKAPVDSIVVDHVERPTEN